MITKAAWIQLHNFVYIQFPAIRCTYEAQRATLREILHSQSVSILEFWILSQLIEIMKCNPKSEWIIIEVFFRLSNEKAFTEIYQLIKRTMVYDFLFIILFISFHWNCINSINNYECIYKSIIFYNYTFFTKYSQTWIKYQAHTAFNH